MNLVNQNSYLGNHTKKAGQEGYGVMSRICSVCGKRPIVGNSVSHSHRKTKRVWRPNIQKVRVVENGRIRRKNVCTRCIRTGKIEKAA
jgi:large subunit ribosomal protein L28